MKHISSALIFFAVLTVLSAPSCRKPAGEGGTSAIRGKVYGYNLRNGVKVDSGYVGDIRVFLHFDDHPWADEEVRTSYTGDYQFQWLTRGKYKVSIISECDSCPMEQTGVFENIEIKKKNETVTAPDLIGYY